MTGRERKLALFLIVAAALGGLYAAWAVVVSPLLDKQKQVKLLQKELTDKVEERDTLTARNKRLQEVVYKRSLPGDPDVAKQEYATALRRILSESKVPAGYTFAERQADQRNVPLIAKGKPYYAKLAYTITLTKVDVGTLVTLLRRFYEMNLLHQITNITVKREDVASLAFDKRQPEKRADLTATLMIEAISLDGVPPRKTLFAAPTGTGALMGGLGLYSLQNTPEVARGIVPQQVTRVLATPDREYKYVVSADAFHGRLPKPEEQPPKKKDEVIVETPKPDLSRYVKFNKLIRSSDGRSWVELYDVHTNSYYSIDIVTRGEKQVAKVSKTAVKEGVRESVKDYPPENWLEVNNSESRVNHKFWIYGVDGDSLLLGERETAPPTAVAQPKSPANKGKQGKGAVVPATPAVVLVTDPKAAVLGGITAIGPKAERFYLWQYGRSMRDVKEITKAEADVVVRRIQGVSPALDKPPEPSDPPAATPAEVAPMPRAVAAGR